MPTLIPPGYSQGILRWSVAGDPEEMISTIGFLGTGTDGQEEADSLYLAATESGSLTNVTAMNKPWTFVGVTVYKRGLGGDPVPYFHNEPFEQTGGSPTSLPSNCALLGHKLTALPGRKNRGRFYFPPALIEESSVDSNGTITVETYSFINARLHTFFTNMVEALLSPMLFHSTSSDATPITAFELDTRIATQRQRMRR